MTVPNLPLNDGHTIPQLGFGVFQVDPDETERVVTDALEVGYRHLDTAQMYRNEKGVGAALAGSGLDRDEVFLTTKLDNGDHRPDDARRAFEESLERLGTDHVDLFLIHWPLPTRYDGDFVSTWETLAQFQQDGRARSIGLSNFEPDHLQRVLQETGVAPAVNQVEVHPWFGNEEVRTANARAGVLTEAWSPIGQGRVLDDPVLVDLAERTGHTPAQVVLRWHLQRGDVIFPKSTHRARMEENFALFDFELSPEDMAAITALDKGPSGRQGPDPATFDRV